MSLAAPVRLRAEHQTDPLGLGVDRPRLSWEVADPRPGARQSAWQVQVAATADGSVDFSAPRWDSAQVSDQRSHLVPWGAAPLGSGERVHWRVRTWDAAGQPSPWSAPAIIEAGLLAHDDWQAQWIGTPLFGSPTHGPAAPVLRRHITVTGRVRRARWYVTALGLVVPSCNGQRVGSQELAPGWQDFRHRVRYQTIDCTAALHAGDNELRVVLGDGWYCGHVGNVGREQYGDRPWLLARLVWEDDTGSHAVVSDDAWEWSTGVNLANDLLMGQTDDLRRREGPWQAVLTRSDPGLALEAETDRGVRAEEELAPVAAPREVGVWNSKRWIIDFGQNLVGRVRLDLELPHEATLTLRHGEILDAKGQLYTDNLRSARCIDVVTAPAGHLRWEPLLTVHGFRYLELTGNLPALPAEAVRAVVLGAGLETIGGFACSDALVNRFQANIAWGLRGNFIEVPTDCPQRDERLGWTGDAQVFCATACLNRDVGRFFAKWQQDLADAQLADGAIPSVAPDPLKSAGDGGPAWSDAMVIVPWTVWRRSGDLSVLAAHFPALCRYVDQLAAKAHELIRSHPDHGWGGFGDWLALDGSGKIDGGTPKDLIGTAYLAYDARLLTEIAIALGRNDDAARYADLQARVTAAFRHRFLTPAGLVAGQTQTALALALFMDLVPERERGETARALARDVRARGVQLATGFVGTPYLLHVLSRFGEDDLAWQLLLRREFPSWLFPVTQGATTVWERWDGWTADKGFQDVGMNSFNHYAYGAVGQWMIERAAGLDQAPGPEGVAYRRLHLTPRPTTRLTHAEAWHRTPYGEARCGWHRDGETVVISGRIPPGCTALLELPVADPTEVAGLAQTRLVAGRVVADLDAGAFSVQLRG